MILVYFSKNGTHIMILNLTGKHHYLLIIKLIKTMIKNIINKTKNIKKTLLIFILR